MTYEFDKLHEECGVFGFYDNDGFDVAKLIYYGLYALQHRGQQSCGIALNSNEQVGRNIFNHHKDMGLVNEVFNNENIAELKGNIGVGHCRYSGLNDSCRENAQPLISRHYKGCMAVAHNGNITNASALRNSMEKNGALFQSNSSTEVILHLAAAARTRTDSIEQAMLKVMEQIEGAYSLVVMSPRKLIGIRDPYGFRPLCIGKLKNSFVLSSETAGLDVIRAEYIRDVEPGELVLINEKGLTSFKNFCGKKPSLCVFEYVYFARPDSIIDGVSVYHARVETGKQLAAACPANADLVVGVPDSGLNFAVGYSLQSGIPYGEGLIKNRYTGRTFIKPTQAEREMAVSVKLNVLKSNVKGKRVVLVDDSIVRGTTSANLVKLMKEAGAIEVHLRVASPPFLWACYFGTDVPDRDSLIAVRHTTEQIRQQIGADSLGFLPIEAFDKIGLREDYNYCKGCFSGKYPIKIENND